MVMNEKAKATIIAKYGSWAEYVRQRYNDPSKSEQRKRVAALGGAKTPKESRGFSNPEIARRARANVGKKKSEDT